MPRPGPCIRLAETLIHRALPTQPLKSGCYIHWSLVEELACAYGLITHIHAYTHVSTHTSACAHIRPTLPTQKPGRSTATRATRPQACGRICLVGPHLREVGVLLVPGEEEGWGKCRGSCAPTHTCSHTGATTRAHTRMQRLAATQGQPHVPTHAKRLAATQGQPHVRTHACSASQPQAGHPYVRTHACNVLQPHRGNHMCTHVRSVLHATHVLKGLEVCGAAAARGGAHVYLCVCVGRGGGKACWYSKGATRAAVPAPVCACWHRCTSMCSSMTAYVNLTCTLLWKQTPLHATLLRGGMSRLKLPWSTSSPSFHTRFVHAHADTHAQTRMRMRVHTHTCVGPCFTSAASSAPAAVRPSRAPPA